MKKMWIGAAALAGALFGQQSPVELKRIPPPAEGVPTPEKYPFGQLGVVVLIDLALYSQTP